MISAALALLALTLSAQTAEERLTRATMVRLDFVEQPAAEVVRRFGEQTDVPFTVYPDDPRAPWRAKRISLVSPDPVPFWQAVDRLGLEAGLILDKQEGRRELRLRSAGGTLGPVFIDRVFRCSLSSLDEEGEVVYGSPPLIHSSFRPAESRPERVQGGASVWERFFAVIAVLAEPRPFTLLRPIGPLRIDVAVDDRGRSLRLHPDPKAFEYPRKYYDEATYAGFRANVYLKRPDPTARTIRRLKGVIPVALWGAHPDVLEIPVEGAVGQTFRGSGVRLKVVSVKRDGANPSLTLDLRPESPVAERAPALFERHEHLLVAHREQFEVLCRAGPPFRFESRSSGIEPGLWRWILRLQTGGSGPAGPPARLRFHGLVRIETDIAFDFSELPLP
jgi:hypothetical protein